MTATFRILPVALALTVACADSGRSPGSEPSTLEIEGPAESFDSLQSPASATDRSIEITVLPDLKLQVKACADPGVEASGRYRSAEGCILEPSPEEACPVVPQQLVAENAKLAAILGACNRFLASGPFDYELIREWSPADISMDPIDLRIEVRHGLVEVAELQGAPMAEGPTVFDIYAEAANLAVTRSAGVEFSFGPSGEIAEIAVKVVGSEHWSVASFSLRPLDGAPELAAR